MTETVPCRPEAQQATSPFDRHPSADELAQLARWNATAVDFVDAGQSLTSLFERQVARTPDAVALEAAGREVSYRALAELARRVDARLRTLGVGAGSLVGVIGERSVELVAAVHGILRSGAAFVPLDPEYPSERIGSMIGETQIAVVLGQTQFLRLVRDSDVVAVDLDALLSGDAEDRNADHELPPAARGEVAYVIHTSGSTGQPKGVANSERGIVNRLLWMRDRFSLGSHDAVLHKTPDSFDVSVWELLWPLQAGARLVVADPNGHRDPAYLVETIVRSRITTVHFVPSMLRVFLDHPAAGTCRSLRTVICSGEALTADLRDRFFEVLPGARLHNLYGPTEAAIDVTAWECRPGDAGAVVPIGAPIANTTIHILDDQMRPVPIGIAGELHIGGVQVALGYVNRADLTAERFISDPFAASGRLYKTGDLARWLADGQIDFLGRMDTQVKVRGQRVELGEIEANLRRHPAVRDAAVTLVDHGGEARLIAHLTWDGDAVPEGELRSFLARRLPSHMIPARFVSRDALPLTSSGKLDRQTLARQIVEAPAHRASAPAEGSTAENDLERFLLDLWCTVLDRPDVGRDDRVFDLGASSLQAAAFVNRVQEALDEFIYVVTVFLAPTVAEYATFLERDYPQAVVRRFGGLSHPARVRNVRVDDRSVREMSELVPRFGTHPSWSQGPPNPSAAFILSPPRSGTTLLRVMLAGHPGIFAAPELQLLGFDTLAQRRSALDGRFSPWREGTIRAVMELEGSDADAATAQMELQEQGGVTSKEFYRWLQHRTDGRMLVDKSPAYALDPDALRNAERGFTSPRYIHLVREPLAMSRSFESYHMDQILFLREHTWPGRTLGELVWTLSHQNILDFAQEVPDERMLQVRFEDLVADPRSEMTEVAAFLGLEFDEGLIRPYDHLETKMVDGLHDESTPMGDTRLLERDRIDPEVLRRWAQPAEDSTLGEPTLRLARRFGYAESMRPLAAGGRRRLADAARQRRSAARSPRG